MEIWKSVVGYEDTFEVSNMGNFRRKGSTKNLSVFIHKSGYCLVGTNPNGRKGKPKTFRVHREVAKCFIPNTQNLPQINHINGDKTDNRVENLEWTTATNNVKHSYDVLNRKPTSMYANQKLSPQEIGFIVKNYTPRHKSFGARALSRKYNTCHTTILRIVRNKGYKT